MMYLRDIAVDLPAAVVSNDDLAREYPSWNLQKTRHRSGVLKRRIVDKDQTALDLAQAACQSLFKRHAGLASKVDAIIFCTESPDHVVPPNSCILHGALDLPTSVLALDITHACSGYVYGLGVAKGLMAAGLAQQILLITSETYSKHINRGDRATRVLFGDGAAVTWLSVEAAEGAGELMDISLATDGKGYESFIVPAGGMRRPKDAETAVEKEDRNGNRKSPENIHMNGLAILNFVKTQVPPQIQELCARQGIEPSDVDLFVPHQASKLALDSLCSALKIPEEKMLCNLEELGNTVSASIPIALASAQAEGRLRPKQKVLLSGFGAGLSWGSALLQY
jgi:3-oxoacyl-[acyl-carrier-protein] synthase-3